MICESLNTVKPDMSVIPAFASLNESAYYVVEAIERDFTELIKSIGIHELGIFESTGSVLLYEKESEEAKEVNEKKEGFLVSVWSKVKAIFEKFLTKIKEIYTNYLEKAGNKIKDKAALEKNISNLKDNFSVKTYKYDGLQQVLEKNVSNLATVASDPTKYEEDKNAANEVIANKNGDIKTIDKINAELRGDSVEITKETLKANFGAIVDATKNYKTTQDNIKKFYNATKNYFDQLIAEEKKAENHSKENLNALKIKANRATMYCSAVLSNYYQKFGTNVKILLILAGASSKKNEPKKDDKAKKEDKNAENVEVQHNSAILEESYQILTEAKWKFMPEFKQPKLNELKDELTDVELFAKDKYDEDTKSKLPKIFDKCLRILDIIKNVGDVLSLPACLLIIPIPFYCLQRCWSWAFRAGQEALAKDRFKAAISKLEKIRDTYCKSKEDKQKIQDKIDHLKKTMEKAEKEGGKNSYDESAFDSELSSLFDWNY